MSRRWRLSAERVLKIILGLVVAGAACGALAGIIGLGLALLFSEGPKVLWDVILMDISGDGLTAFGLAALVGAVLGSLCAPPAGWLLLRRVPLGRAFAWLTGGTISGGVAGWVLPAGLDPLVGAVLWAFGGFLTAALVLRRGSTRNSPLLHP